MGPIDNEPNGALFEGKTLLLIDDEEVIREIGCEMVEALGMICITAATGEEGIEIYSRNKERISFVVLDIELPGITGDRVYKELKAIDHAVKVLFASGYAKDYLEVRYFDKQKLEHFMSKPFQLNQLKHKLSQILGPAGIDAVTDQDQE